MIRRIKTQKDAKFKQGLVENAGNPVSLGLSGFNTENYCSLGYSKLIINEEWGGIDMQMNFWTLMRTKCLKHIFLCLCPPNLEHVSSKGHWDKNVK